MNRWASPESLANLSESNKRCSDFFYPSFIHLYIKSCWNLRIELIEALHNVLNPEKHDRVNLNSRFYQIGIPFCQNFQLKLWNRWYHTDYLNNFSTSLTSRRPIELKGGLCGLAALYWALTDTFFNPSQLLRLSLWVIWKSPSRHDSRGQDGVRWYAKCHWGYHGN